MTSKSRKQRGQPIEAIGEQLRSGTRPEESFRLLFDRFYWPLFRLFEGRGFPTEECRDLIQETFLRVYRGSKSFRGEARWEHWIFRIASNTADSALRHGAAAKRTGRTVPWEGEDAGGSPCEADVASPGDTDDPAPLRRLLDKERKELLSRAVDGLPAQMQRCVRLRVFQDLDYEDIADILQISPSTVKVQLFKARKRLQSELEDSLADFDL